MTTIRPRRPANQRTSSQSARAAALLAVGLSFLAACSGADPADERLGRPLSGTASESHESLRVEDTLAAAWLDATRVSLGPTAEWTNNVEAADLDADGDLDLLFANSGDERYWTWRTVCS